MQNQSIYNASKPDSRLWKILLVLLDSIPEAVRLKNLRSLDWRIMESKKVMEEEEEMWRREIVTSVMRIVSTRLPQRDLISLLLVSPWLYRTLVSYPSIWLVNKSLTLLLRSFQVFNFTTMLFFQNIDLRERTNAGDRLLAALSLVS